MRRDSHCIKQYPDNDGKGGERDSESEEEREGV